MDIDGLGEKQVGQLQKAGLVTTAADFYRLTAEQLLELEGYGEISANRTVQNIADSKERPFGRVLFAIGLEEVGFVTGRNLAQRFRSIDALHERRAPRTSSRRPGVGPKMARRIHEQLADEQMRALIEDLRAVGVSMALEGPPPGEGPLAGKTFVLTGTLPDLTREEATERIEGAGRPRDLRRVEEDRLRRRGRLAGHEAREGRAARRARARRGRAAGAAPADGPAPERASAYSTVTSSIMPFATCGLPPLRSLMKQMTA